ncbi:MAG: hypothetical protein ACI8XZ_005516 [Gammaproteobacteria bacterium]|jgi:hypothetical protein
MNYTQPTDKQFESFQNACNPSEKVVMLNLLKFRAAADYSNSPNESACSGREAFNRHEKHVAPLIESLGVDLYFSMTPKERSLVRKENSGIGLFSSSIPDHKL